MNIEVFKRCFCDSSERLESSIDYIGKSLLGSNYDSIKNFQNLN